MTVLLQNGADLSVRNADGRTALDLAEASAKAVLTGEWIFPCTTDNVVMCSFLYILTIFSHFVP